MLHGASGTSAPRRRHMVLAPFYALILGHDQYHAVAPASQPPSPVRCRYFRWLLDQGVPGRISPRSSARMIIDSGAILTDPAGLFLELRQEHAARSGFDALEPHTRGVCPT